MKKPIPMPKTPALSAEQLSRLFSRSVSAANESAQRVAPLIQSIGTNIQAAAPYVKDGLRVAAPYIEALANVAINDIAERHGNNPHVRYLARNRRKIKNSAAVMGDAAHHVYRIVKK